MHQKNRHTLRPLMVVAIFCLICVVYLGRLFYIQIAGKIDLYNAGKYEAAGEMFLVNCVDGHNTVLLIGRSAPERGRISSAGNFNFYLILG